MKDAINKLIAERTHYGVRIVTMIKPATIMCWSNGSANWYTYHPDSISHIKKGEEISLDANQIIVPFKRNEVLKIIEDVDQLPLYANSFEFSRK